MSRDAQAEGTLMQAAHCQQLVADMRGRNLRELVRLYSARYRREREHPEWIDFGGEA